MLTVSVGRLKEPQPRLFSAHETTIEGNPAIDEAALAEVRAAFAACDADVPMLMLPVRIETRFMTAAYDSGEATTIAHLVDGVQLVLERLALLAGSPMPPAKVRGETPAQRKARKDVTRSQLRTVVQIFRAASQAAFATRRNLRSSLATATEQAAVSALQQGVAALPAALAAARAHLLAYPHLFTRDRLARLADRLDTRYLAPLASDLATTLPALTLSASLAWSAGVDVLASCVAASAAIQAATAAADPAAKWPAADAAIAKVIAASWGVIRTADPAAISAALADVRGKLNALAIAGPMLPIADRLRALGPTAILDAPRFAATASAIAACSDRVRALTALLDAATVDRAGIAATVEALAMLVRELLIVPRTSSLPKLLAGALARVAPLAAAWRAASDALGNRDRGVLAAISRIERAGEALATGIRELRLDAAPEVDRTREPRLIALAYGPNFRLRPELWVRIFPDQIFHTGHTPALDPAETEAGAQFWADLAAAHGDRAAQLAAWMALARRFGARRAAWIRATTSPAPEKASVAPWESLEYELGHVEQQLAAPRALDAERFGRVVDRLHAHLAKLADAGHLPDAVAQRIAGRLHGALARARYLQTQHADPRSLRSSVAKLQGVAAGIENVAPVATPAPTLRLTTTLSPPRTPALPARFTVVTAQAGLVTHVVTGARVDPDLELGIRAGSAFAADEYGNLVSAPELRWMFDFDAAVTAGMAVRVPISEAELRQGFDRVFVVGVPNGDPVADRARVEALLEGHRYGPDGLGFMAYASATNNTAEEVAAWTSEQDPEAEWERVTAPPVVASGDPTTETDAVRWATACGIDVASVAQVAHAGERSLAQAEIAKRALVPGTLGAYLEDMIAPIAGAHAAEILAFYVDGVAPRGIAPTIRVGTQPYGLLATTAYSLYDPRAAIRGTVDADPFSPLLFTVLDALRADFLSVAEAAVPHATAAQIGSAQDNFLRILGTYAHSLDFSARFAVNANFSRGPSPGASHDQSALGLLQRFMPIALAAAGIPNESRPVVNGTPIDALASIADAIGAVRPLALRLLQKPKPAIETIASDDTPAALATIAAAAVRDLRSASVAPAVLDEPLLVRLARHAKLYAWLQVALDLLMVETAGQASGALTHEIRARLGSADGFSITTSADLAFVSKFSFLTRPLGDLVGALGLAFDATPPQSLFAFLTGKAMVDYLGDLVAGTTAFPRRADHEPFRVRLVAHARVLQQLAAMSPAVQRHLAAEHVDTVSHRLDAWISGLAHRRLSAMRRGGTQGVHLAAFGFVHDLRPDETTAIAPAGLPGAFKADGGRVRVDPRNQGFVHTPSISHAIAAAVLRSTYVAESAGGTTDLDNRMAVDLSSRRVRLALGILDGTRGGSSLSALLGYRLERALHDRTDDTYDDIVFALRQAYPTATTVDPSSPDPQAVRQVVDGHAVITAVQGWLASQGSTYRARGRLIDALPAAAYPWGLRGLPPAHDPRVPGILDAIDETADALDAVGDLVLSEGVYQLVRGNRVRAGAIMQALAEGRAIPAPEIVEFPRTGAVVSHRYVAIIDASQRPAGWSAARPRAVAEPRVDAWIGSFLGPASQIELTVRIDDEVHAVTLDQLDLCPLDLFYAFGPGTQADAVALQWRAARRVATFDELAAARAIAIEPDAQTPGKVPLDHAIAVIEALAAALAHAKPLVGADLYSDASGAAIDPGELRARIAAIAAAIMDLGNRMYAAFAGAAPADAKAWLAADLGAASRVDVRRDADLVFRLLAEVTAHGLGSTLPRTWKGSDAEALSLSERFTAALRAVRDRATVLATTDPQLDAAGCAAVLASTVGDGLPIVAAFATIAAQAPGAVATTADALDQFCTVAGFVRTPVRELAQARDLAALAAVRQPPPNVVQRPAGIPWAGGAIDLPVGAPEVTCYTVLGTLPVARTTAGLLLDAWTDIIPFATEISGVAVSYDQPDSQPPQAMLLVVPPRLPTGPRRWAFDDLVVAIDDTFDLAKIRAIEPEQLAAQPYAPLLPMTVGEIVPRAVSTPTAASGERVMLDFGGE